jgi:RNA polymerase sigma-70 factor, ECF subfamily
MIFEAHTLMIPDFEQLLETAPADPRLGELLVSQYYDAIFRLALSILNDPQDADDATQMAFIRAFKSLGQYKTGTNFRGWLFTIAVNTSRDLLRRRKTRQRFNETLKSFLHMENRSPTTEEIVLHNERSGELWRAVSRLDDKHRLPVLLRYVHGLPVREIADILETNEGTVHSRLHHAARKLATLLGSAPEPSGEVHDYFL